MMSSSASLSLVAVVAVGLDGGVDAHLLRGGEELDREPVLHQRLTAAQGEAALHDLEAVAVLPQLLRRPGHRHRNAVASGSRCPGCGSTGSATCSL